MNEQVTRMATRGLLYLKKYSPEILTGLGVVGSVATTVMTAKATLELEPLVDKTKAEIEYAKDNHMDNPQSPEAKKELAYAYTRAGLRVGKLYGPAFSMGVASIGCILAAHGIMRRRNAALVAGYKVLESAFNEYRARIADEVGEDKEKELYFNLKEFAEGGEADSKSVDAPQADSTQLHSQYARCFEATNPNYQPNSEYNLMFLRAQQNYANDLLKSRGHVFLNDVYDQLGFPRSKAGAVVGWVYNGDGDNFIDFGIYDLNRPMALQFVNGNENAVWLDFNVDGVVYDLI